MLLFIAAGVFSFATAPSILTLQIAFLLHFSDCFCAPVCICFKLWYTRGDFWKLSILSLSFYEQIPLEMRHNFPGCFMQVETSMGWDKLCYVEFFHVESGDLHRKSSLSLIKCEFPWTSCSKFSVNWRGAIKRLTFTHKIQFLCQTRSHSIYSFSQKHEKLNPNEPNLARDP